MNLLEDLTLSMSDLIEEAKDRDVKPEDLFSRYDMLVDAQEFFDSIVEGKSQEYKQSPFNRIMSNNESHLFYKVLLDYLDSLGLNGRRTYRISPALVSINSDGTLNAEDGRHRAALCIVLGIKLPVRIIDSNTGLLSESFLDKDQRFYDYKTKNVSGDNIFDTDVGESSFAKDMIQLAKTDSVDNEGHYAYYKMMSPREYFQATAEGFGNSVANNVNNVEQDKSVLKDLNDVLDKYGKSFPVTYLDYSFDKFSQEGRHRMYIAAKRFGWDKKFPVLIIKTTDEGTRKHNEEKISRYINKAVRSASRYSYDDLSELKDQFISEIENYIDNPTVEIKESEDTITFIVNDVEYEEYKDIFNIRDTSKVTNNGDESEDDLYDLFELSDIV